MKNKLVELVNVSKSFGSTKVFVLSVDLRNQTVEKSFLTERILQMFQRISEI